MLLFMLFDYAAMPLMPLISRRGYAARCYSYATALRYVADMIQRVASAARAADTPACCYITPICRFSLPLCFI